MATQHLKKFKTTTDFYKTWFEGIFHRAKCEFKNGHQYGYPKFRKSQYIIEFP